MTEKMFILLIASTICFCPVHAQKRKGAKARKPAVVVPERTPEEKLFDELLPATAKVMFIDSIVVNKVSFLSQLPISSDMGRIMQQDNEVEYINEFGNTRITASGDTINGRHLYISHKYGNTWTERHELKELPQAMANYPFMLSDGITLYFSAEGKGTIGGRDIFRTTYNADNSRFYEATNLGMPYNSTANDYLLAISDMDNIGLLVSDRFQSEDKVCIYIFEPTAQRKTFDEDTDKDTLRKYAAVEQIKDTWSFGDRNAALKRRDALLARLIQKEENKQIAFIVNDKTTYTSLSDFQSSNSRRLYQDIIRMKSQIDKLSTVLNDSRDRYSVTTHSKRHEIGRQIVKLEKKILTLDEEIKNREKELRNIENKHN